MFRIQLAILIHFYAHCIISKLISGGLQIKYPCRSLANDPKRPKKGFKPRNGRMTPDQPTHQQFALSTAHGPTFLCLTPEQSLVHIINDLHGLMRGSSSRHGPDEIRTTEYEQNGHDSRPSICACSSAFSCFIRSHLQTR